MSVWLSRFTDQGTTARLGPLEWRVLEALWASEDARSVRDLHPEFVDLAYTTLTSTLERLCQKGLLERFRHGRAFVYRPLLSCQQLNALIAKDAVRAALKASDPKDTGPLLTAFVEAVNERDPRLLDTIAAEIRVWRAKFDDSPG